MQLLTDKSPSEGHCCHGNLTFVPTIWLWQVVTKAYSMMSHFTDCISQQIRINGQTCMLNSASLPAAEQEIYEILRVIDGVPIFIEDHIARFAQSARILGITLRYPIAFFAEEVLRVIDMEQMDEGNIKFSYLNAGESSCAVFYAATFSYPDAGFYRTGATTDLLYAGRANPNAKNVQPVRQQANDFLARTGVYEALLVNRHGNITEGSRSNLFFQKGACIVTAPAEEVLIGITRKYVIEAVRRCGLSLQERSFNTSELADTDSAFIAGTSPKVLPIANIGAHRLQVGTPEQLCIMDQYDQILKEYIFTAKKEK